MKRWKKALVSLLTGCLVCGMIPVNAKAAESRRKMDMDIQLLYQQEIRG